MDLLSFALLTFSSIFILIDPITVTLFFVSSIKDVSRVHQRKIARDASLYALAILLVFAIGGYGILQLFGITLAALRIGGGVLLFLIGIEMVYARVSYTKQPITERRGLRGGCSGDALGNSDHSWSRGNNNGHSPHRGRSRTGLAGDCNCFCGHFRRNRCRLLCDDLFLRHYKRDQRKRAQSSQPCAWAPSPRNWCAIHHYWN